MTKEISGFSGIRSLKFFGYTAFPKLMKVSFLWDKMIKVLKITLFFFILVTEHSNVWTKNPTILSWTGNGYNETARQRKNN